MNRKLRIGKQIGISEITFDLQPFNIALIFKQQHFSRPIFKRKQKNHPTFLKFLKTRSL